MQTRIRLAIWLLLCGGIAPAQQRATPRVPHAARRGETVPQPPPPPAPPPTMELRWTLMNQDIAGGNFNGFAETCAEAGVRSLTVTATDEASGRTRTTRGIACPAGDTGGTALVTLPAGEGPLRFEGRADGKPGSASTRVCHAERGQYASIWIFVDGCTSPKCVDRCPPRPTTTRAR